ncbi:MAG: putative Rrf2 family DNA-binding protein [Firmicutes bacterium]|nr:putative Rrf2 family DNA-binding protein [Bacillota bacterium]
MLITRETDYSIRILRALAKRGRLTAAELTEDEQIPLAFAYKILKKLQKGGFLRIFRGPGGGYLLAVSLDKVTLYDLMQVTEDPFYVSPCILPDHLCPWCDAHPDEVCRAHLHLQAIQKTLEDELKAKSLHQVFFGE